MRCGLLGETLKHSYSPEIHSALVGDVYDYSLFEMPIQDVEQFIKHGDWDGLNVTIPYKKTVLEFCDEVSPLVRKIGSANTLIRQADGKVAAYNTDAFGFSKMFETIVPTAETDIATKPLQEAYILGSGGAAVMVGAVLKEAGFQPQIVSRSGELNYKNIYDRINENKENKENIADSAKKEPIIINTTPVGMFPNNYSVPLDLKRIETCQAVVELIANPLNTQLMLDAARQGLPSVGGLLMLVEQARKSAELFTGSQISDGLSMSVYEKIRCDKTNVVLIGMPGCGKTTIGKALAEETKREFVDTDELIETINRQTPAEIIETQGEAVFREKETSALRVAAQQNGRIIATGGGVVTREINRDILAQNSVIVYIDREVSMLSINGRPLSKKGMLAKMEAERKPLYELWSDYRFENKGSSDTNGSSSTVVDVVEKIRKMVIGVC